MSSWPNEAASRLKLLVTSDIYPDHASKACHLRYDPENRYLSVILDDNDETLDVIDIDDMIGSRVEINVDDSTMGPTLDKNAANEPDSAVLVDRNGHATLHLFVYPRHDLTESTFLQRIGLSPRKHKPNPSYVRKTTGMGVRSAFSRKFVLSPSEDLQDASAVASSLQKMCSKPRADRFKKYLVLVNPMSGPKRNGVDLATKTVEPMLDEAGIEAEICVTTHANHAFELASSDKDLARYDALILVGGDGIVHEVLNGIAERDDKDHILKTMKFGIVGCGTANGLATSICHRSGERYGPVTECFLVCKGDSFQCDMSKFNTTNSSYISFLTYSWGMLADIDIESERLHCLGETRFDIWAVLKVLLLKRYKGKLSYTTTPSTTAPMLSSAVPSDWSSIDGDFLTIWSSQVTHAAVRMYQVLFLALTTLLRCTHTIVPRVL